MFCGLEDEPVRPKIGAGMIIKKGDEILLGMRRKQFGGGKLSLPGGHVEMFERAEEAARREAIEECGLQVGECKLCGFTEDFDKSLDKHYITIYFIGEYIGGEPIETEPDKHGDWKWYKISELKQLEDKLWFPCVEKFRALGWM